MNSSRLSVLTVFVALAVASSGLAADDAEVLARRVPNQRYAVGETFSLLNLHETWWGIPLWACDPARLTIVKVLGGSAAAPYALAITPAPGNPIEEIYTHRRLQTIHLLAASERDAVAIRRALIAEIDAMQQRIEKRQGNEPGFLRANAHSATR